MKGQSLKKRYFSMHSHSFQDTELKLYRHINYLTGQVVEGLEILRYPWGLEIKG